MAHSRRLSAPAERKLYVHDRRHTHTHTARTLGFADRISTLYLSVERWRLPSVSAQGRAEPRTLQKRTCRQRVFHEVSKRRLRQDRGREPCTNDDLSDAATDTGNPTVDVWTPSNKGNATLAYRSSSITTNQNCRAGSTVSSVGNEPEGHKQVRKSVPNRERRGSTCENIPRRCCCYGNAMDGRRVPHICGRVSRTNEPVLIE